MRKRPIWPAEFAHSEYSRLQPLYFLLCSRIMSADPVRDRPRPVFPFYSGLPLGFGNTHTIVAPRRSVYPSDTALAAIPVQSLFTKHRQRRGLVVLYFFNQR